MTRDNVLLSATAHPIERMDDHVVLSVDYSIAEDSPSTLDPDSPLSMGYYLGLSSGGYGQMSGIRLVNFSSDRVWDPGTVGDWRSATTQDSLLLRDRGQTVTSVTFFGPVDVDSVDVLLPNLGLVEDVPVVEGGSGTADLASLGVGDGPARYGDPYALESLVRAYDGDASVQKQGDSQIVVMASDVLFATDVAELSPEAAARVDEVAEQIAEVASEGEVRVVGHTDDVLSAEYNLDLSQRRAASVADRMEGVLGSSFTVVKEGKGKSEPAVEGTDAAARAVNRRVEIEFSATEAVRLPGESTDLPDATGPVGTGHDPVTLLLGGDTSTFTLEVPSVVRCDGYLVGTIVVKLVEGGTEYSVAFADVLSDYRAHSGQRDTEFEEIEVRRQSAKNVTLMGPEGRVFPARYWLTGNNNDPAVRLLADRRLPTSMVKGDTATFTVVWPDTGQDLVTVDSPDRFRITDIPVEEE